MAFHYSSNLCFRGGLSHFSIATIAWNRMSFLVMFSSEESLVWEKFFQSVELLLNRYCLHIVCTADLLNLFHRETMTVFQLLSLTLVSLLVKADVRIVVTL